MPYGRRYGPYRRYSRGQRRSAAGQGGMRAEFSGNQQIIRHSVKNAANLDSIAIADGTAVALPLLVYTGDSNNSTSFPDSSIQATYAEGSRVNHIQIQMQITQADATKPNAAYIGFISVSFSDAMLDIPNMEPNFANLIGVEASGATFVSTINTDGQFFDGGLPGIEPQPLTINDYLKSPKLRHWIRGLARNRYTLYSGRPIISNQVMPVPLKNKRGQFGSAWFMVVMNESGALQGEDPGDGTSINLSMQSFFKEIPLQPAIVTP